MKLRGTQKKEYQNKFIGMKKKKKNEEKQMCISSKVSVGDELNETKDMSLPAEMESIYFFSLSTSNKINDKKNGYFIGVFTNIFFTRRR